jgi:outer membrane lipoprotein-sorting protein
MFYRNSSSPRLNFLFSSRIQKNLLLFIILASLLPVSSGLSLISPDITSKEIIARMHESAKNIRTLKFQMKKLERVDGRILSGDQEVKFNRMPKKIYTFIHAPRKGTEVLFIEGSNNNKAYVNPNGFPYFTLSLDPYSNAMRNNNHHTVHEVGFDYINSIVSYFSEKAGGDFEKIFIYKGDTVFNNRKCYKILIDYFPFQYIKYTVKENENLIDIAYRNFISDYMILQLNPDIDDYYDVKAGQAITIPNGYARKTLLFIDKENYLPIVQIMFDEKGLYAKYEFHDLQYNPKISEEEFTKDYEAYNF